MVNLCCRLFFLSLDGKPVTYPETGEDKDVPGWYRVHPNSGGTGPPPADLPVRAVCTGKLSLAHATR